VLLTSGCSAKEMQQKEKKKDFSYLKIQTVLPPEDQTYYKRVHNQISEIGKHFAYREKNAEKKYCPILEKMFDEISVRPFSRERERERVLLQSICPQFNRLKSKYEYNLSREKFLYLSKQLPLSASLKLDRGNSLWIDPKDLVVWKDYLLFNFPRIENKDEAYKYENMKRDYSNKRNNLAKVTIIYK
jgi:hypothetical protein